MAGLASSTIADRLILVGCGNMGYALLRSWLASKSVDPKHVHVVEPIAGLRERAAQLGITVHEGPETLPDRADLVVLALKPQVLATESPVYRRFSEQAVFVSIAAGVTIAKLVAMLGGARVIRALPNTPTAIGKGSTVIFSGDHVPRPKLDEVISLFAAGGSVHQVDNELFLDAATAISGSGPAYIFYLMECLSTAAHELGLPQDLARKLAKETVYGAGALAMQTEDDPAELRRQVTSAKGTTEAGLSLLTAEDELMSLIRRTTKAAFDRSKALSASA
ncbi:pyrroline-5-carboxylate reductase [Bradyrhizobium sp. CCGUVB1N3]|uniref:pyrroline-5-carboxylate reductase n=1 Tax=Bradyrhizobium sp. CCGUVB1N3 TaxID=2949629 RepID=UPI0020B3D6E9|nr:pyrroline-5-carboxylate reductase [Bradyrhizobium sp. CCGUVB1N3]MCP3476459.1 pyrroline-5-carboxylate reductase [Bradyrhizobium sp. CCGUVB1N3]